MGSDTVVNQLLEADVLSTVKDDELRLTSSFEEQIAEYEVMIQKQGLSDAEADLPLEEEDLPSSEEVDPTAMAFYLALDDRIPDLSHERARDVVAAVQHLRRSRPTNGSPKAFVPIDANQLTDKRTLPPRTIVYVWKHDCPPCDDMKQEFDEIFGQSPEDIALFSVYGPDWTEVLYEEFAVRGAPTTLFMIDGQVDARLEGTHYRSVIEHEIEQLRVLTTTE